MESKRVLPSVLGGSVKVPPSKSMAHRALICAGLAGGVSMIRNLAFSEDIRATMACLEALGAGFEETPDGLLVHGIGGRSFAGERVFRCGESGSTLRFMIPIASAVGRGENHFHGEGRLSQRPLTVYEELLPQHGIEWKRGAEALPLVTRGGLDPGQYKLAGNVSSQFVSGLLLALPLLAGDSEIILTTELESEPYVELTMAAMADFGVHVERKDRIFVIPGGQAYRPTDYTVEGDDSQAAFLLAAGALAGSGEGLLIEGLAQDSRQGDRVMRDLLVRMGVKLEWSERGLIVYPAAELHSDLVIDASQTPDLVPIQAAVGAVARGRMHIVRAGRLRIKESDRLRAVHEEYAAAGAEMKEGPDDLIITGHPEGLAGGTADSRNDHRIAMSLAVLAQRTREGILITDSGSVRKSWPGFWEDFARIGGKYE